VATAGNEGRTVPADRAIQVARSLRVAAPVVCVGAALMCACPDICILGTPDPDL